MNPPIYVPAGQTYLINGHNDDAVWPLSQHCGNLPASKGSDIVGEVAASHPKVASEAPKTLRITARQQSFTRQSLRTTFSSLSPIASHVMNSREAAPLVFHPAYCFPASPTYFAWVKLTASDIHHVLRSRSGFAASTTSSKSELLFYLNHPIQFVQVTGVIVQYEDYFEKFWSFVVDDGSGGVIECVCWKPDTDQVTLANPHVDNTKQEKSKVDLDNSDIDQEKSDVDRKERDVDQEKRENVIKSVDIGIVVQVKGTISTFRGIRQIQIERLSVVSTSNDEVKLIAVRTKFLQEVLLKPWVVSLKQQKRLLKEAQGEKHKDSEKLLKLKERQKKLEEREERHAKRIAKEYEAEEGRRMKDAEAAREAGKDLQLPKLREKVSDDFDELTY